MRRKAIPAAAEDPGAKGFINRFSIGRRLALCFVGIFVLLFAVNGILLWQFHSAQVRADRRLTGVSLELIAALNLQSSLQSFNGRLDRVAQSQDAILLRQESESLRDIILDSVQDARNAITHLPPEVRLYATFVPTIEVIESTLPSQLESLNSLAASGDWSAVRLRLANQKQPLDAETSMLVKSISRQLNDELGQTVTNIARVERQMAIVLPLTALGTLLIASLFGLMITRSITTPLGKLMEGSSALSRGEFDHLVSISGDDELARLGRVFNDTAGKLQSLYETLQESTAKLEEAQRITHVGYWEWDILTDRVNWSDETYRIYGLGPQERPMDLATVREKIHPEDWGCVFRALEDALSGGARYNVECRVFRPTGEVRIIDSRGDVKRDTSGRPTLMFGTVQDITNRKRAEQRLRESEAYLAEAQRLSQTGSWAWNPATGDIRYWSEMCYCVLGFDPAGPLPRFEEFFHRIHPDDQAATRERFEKAIRDKADFELDYRVVHPEKGIRDIHVVGHAVLDGSSILEFVGTVIDITELKSAEQERERLRQLEADLAHVNRVSTLGEMAASLAHEIKQPIAAAITSASSCIEWLAHEPPNLDRARVAAARIDKYGNRAAEIIDRIRSLYKKSPPQRELVDMNGIIQEMLTLLKGEAHRYPIAMRAELTSELPKIMVDRVQLQQVFMNLMLNAVEAMKDSGGELTVKSELQDGQLQFSVSDTGVGLPSQQADQIFSAFFTTKPQGSGMGLAISRSIVESHGGRLWATANDGRGATFHFTLPIQVMESSPLVA